MGVFYFIFFSMGFCSGGILVGSGGMVGMVEALSSGGAMIEVEGRWRRKLEKKKKKKYILLCRYIILVYSMVK